MSRSVARTCDKPTLTGPCSHDAGHAERHSGETLFESLMWGLGLPTKPFTVPRGSIRFMEVPRG